MVVESQRLDRIQCCKSIAGGLLCSFCAKKGMPQLHCKCNQAGAASSRSYSWECHSPHCICMQRLIHFEVWRWCFFVAGQAPVYFLGEFIVHVCFLFAENLFFKVTFAFYYAVSVKVGCLFLAPIACKQN